MRSHHHLHLKSPHTTPHPTGYSGTALPLCHSWNLLSWFLPQDLYTSSSLCLKCLKYSFLRSLLYLVIQVLAQMPPWQRAPPCPSNIKQCLHPFLLCHSALSSLEHLTTNWSSLVYLFTCLLPTLLSLSPRSNLPREGIFFVLALLS